MSTPVVKTPPAKMLPAKGLPAKTPPAVADAPTHDPRVAFAEELMELACADERIVAVCNDSVGSSNLVEFARRFPDRLVNVGIAEQNMIGVGAGLAAGGMIPFVCGAAPFLTGRSLEQIKADVAYSRHPVIMCGMSPGLSYGALGPTHHSVEDLSWLRALPGLDIIVPADRAETRQALRRSARDPRPTFIRIGRTPVPDVTCPDDRLRRGRFTQLRDGSDATIIAVGVAVARALRAAAELADEGVGVRVLNAAYVAPLDTQAIIGAASQTHAIVVAEEANLAGGLGAAVASVVSQLGRAARVPMRLLGLAEFAPTGSSEFLLDYFGLTAAKMRSAVLEALLG